MSEVAEFLKGKGKFVVMGAAGLGAVFLLFGRKTSSSGDGAAYPMTVSQSSNPNAATKDDIAKAVADYGKSDQDATKKALDDYAKADAERTNQMATQLVSGFTQSISKQADAAAKQFDEVGKRFEQVGSSLQKQHDDMSNLYGGLTQKLDTINTSITGRLQAVADQRQQQYSPPSNPAENSHPYSPTPQPDPMTQIKQNGAAYNATDNAADKQRLHDENLRLGASIGATYDSGRGEWTKNGQVIN